MGEEANKFGGWIACGGQEGVRGGRGGRYKMGDDDEMTRWRTEEWNGRGEEEEWNGMGD